MKDFGFLILRLVLGGLMTGHGAQKLFGWFGGHGLEGTASFMEMLGLRPGSRWASLAGFSEFGGGLLTSLGLLHPLGPIMLLGPMFTAVRKVHWNKPIWATAGGAELPVLNAAAALALATNAPGRYSLDRFFGTRVPPIVTVAVLTSVVIGALVTETATQNAEEQAARTTADERDPLLEEASAPESRVADASAEN